jgi:hypothetical protein
MLLLTLAHFGSAQAPIEEGVRYDERGWPLGGEAEVVADAAIAVWLTREPLATSDLVGLDAAQICAALPAIVQNPPPAAGTEVRGEDRREWDRNDGDDSLRSFTYAAIRPGDRLDVVQVDLRLTDAGYRVERVGFRSSDELSGMRAWLQTSLAAGLFAGGTLVLLIWLAVPGSLPRRVWASARHTMIGHRRTILATMAMLTSVFLLGVGTGNGLPDGCEVAMLAIVGEAVGQLGASEAYGSGNIARAAALTFYQNFVVVTFSVHFFLVMLLGFPSYLLAIVQFFVLGIPFGLLQGLTAWGWVPVVALIAIELSAYFLVISGGGIVFGSVLRRGWRSYPEALRAAASLLLPAGLLLLAGAWYEAILLIGL